MRKILFKICSFLCASSVLASLAACSEGELIHEGDKMSVPENVVLTSGEQALALKSLGDCYAIEIYIIDGKDYVPLFSTELKELVPGLGNPSSYEKKTVGGKDAVVMKGGNDDHTFALTCTALEESGLIHFAMDAKIGKAFSLEKRDFGLAMSGQPEVSYGQMPTSIYGNMSGYDNVGIGMPAAYLWDEGREAIILFDYTDMTWMQKGVFQPGRHAYVDAKVRENGTTSFGLCYGTDAAGRPLEAGSCARRSISIEFYLYAGPSAKRQGVSCIARKAEVMSSVHPTMVEYPQVRSDLAQSVSLSWANFAAGTAKSLLHPLAYNTVSMNLTDPILASEKRGSTYYVGYSRQSAERYTMTDFSCNNNWLSSFLAYNRLNPDEAATTMLASKMDGLQFYYDPDSDMIRWGFRYKNQVGEYSMPWQNGFYHAETYRASMHASAEDYSPAALSNLLSSVKGGWTELIQSVNYVLPQWTDPVKKTAETQQDVPALNIVYEPWQIGTYAYTCLKCYDVTGDKAYIDLASVALNKVINEVTYKVSNQIYTQEYNDSAEFPITEVFGTANGTYACYRLFELTGKSEWQTYSEAFFGMLAQLTFWYDDNMSEAALNSTLVGLFEPHGGAAHPCPWESIEAVLPLTEILNSTDEYLFNDLILAILNTQRVSAYNYYPVVWSGEFAEQLAYQQSDFYYIPTEPMYNSIGNGNSDYGALYMSSISFWNYLMYEAFATANDPDVMILNTNVQSDFESAIQGTQRKFVLYNPKDEEVTVTVTYRELAEGSYVLTVDGKSQECTKAQLEKGISYTVPARSDLRIRLVAKNVQRLEDANRDTMTRYRLALAYNTVVESVQAQAKNNFSKIFPNVSDSVLEDVSNYVMTYVTYEEAMTLALSVSTIEEAKALYVDRVAVSAEAKALYNERTDLHLSEAYVTLTSAVDEATTLYREGQTEEAYSLSDNIVKAIQNGQEDGFLKVYKE